MIFQDLFRFLVSLLLLLAPHSSPTSIQIEKMSFEPYGSCCSGFSGIYSAEKNEKIFINISLVTYFTAEVNKTLWVKTTVDGKALIVNITFNGTATRCARPYWLNLTVNPGNRAVEAVRAYCTGKFCGLWDFQEKSTCNLKMVGKELFIKCFNRSYEILYRLDEKPSTSRIVLNVSDGQNFTFLKKLEAWLEKIKEEGKEVLLLTYAPSFILENALESSHGLIVLVDDCEGLKQLFRSKSLELFNILLEEGKEVFIALDDKKQNIDVSKCSEVLRECASRGFKCGRVLDE